MKSDITWGWPTISKEKIQITPEQILEEKNVTDTWITTMTPTTGQDVAWRTSQKQRKVV